MPSTLRDASRTTAKASTRSDSRLAPAASRERNSAAFVRRCDTPIQYHELDIPRQAIGDEKMTRALSNKTSDRCQCVLGELNPKEAEGAGTRNNPKAWAHTSCCLAPRWGVPCPFARCHSPLAAQRPPYKASHPSLTPPDAASSSSRAHSSCPTPLPCPAPRSPPPPFPAPAGAGAAAGARKVRYCIIELYNPGQALLHGVGASHVDITRCHSP